MIYPLRVPLCLTYYDRTHLSAFVAVYMPETLWWYGVVNLLLNFFLLYSRGICDFSTSWSRGKYTPIECLFGVQMVHKKGGIHEGRNCLGCLIDRLPVPDRIGYELPIPFDVYSGWRWLCFDNPINLVIEKGDVFILNFNVFLDWWLWYINLLFFRGRSWDVDFFLLLNTYPILVYLVQNGLCLLFGFFAYLPIQLDIRCRGDSSCQVYTCHWWSGWSPLGYFIYGFLFRVHFLREKKIYRNTFTDQGYY